MFESAILQPLISFLTMEEIAKLSRCSKEFRTKLLSFNIVRTFKSDTEECMISIKGKQGKCISLINSDSLIYFYLDGKREGVCRRYEQKKEGFFSILNPDSGKITLSRFKLFSLYHYKNDKLDGEYIIYDEEGKVSIRSNYREGKLEGLWSMNISYLNKSKEIMYHDNWIVWEKDGELNYT